jgi:molybdopterin synthase catalytic subunit
VNKPFRITREPLLASEVLGHVEHHGAGQGRPVLELEYSAYESMAEKEMLRIATAIADEFPGIRLAAHHRIGLLQLGDAAIICAASAPHRAEAFLACRKLIDEIKAHVPIWKRERGPDGEAWVGWTDARCLGDHAHAEHEASSPDKTVTQTPKQTHK